MSTHSRKSSRKPSSASVENLRQAMDVHTLLEINNVREGPGAPSESQENHMKCQECNYKSNTRLSIDGTLRSDDNLMATEEESNSTLNMNSIDDSDRLNPIGSLQPDVAIRERKRIPLTKR